MKKNYHFILILAVAFVLTCARCEREPCHSKVTIRNNSIMSIVVAYRFRDISNNCRLDGPTITPDMSLTFDAPDKCWEYEKTFDAYLLNAATYDNSQFTNCDSLAFDYDILEHWTFTSADLEVRNFELSYP